ncbi:MAG: NADH-quinone oxidoreductase subunit NuoG, partial [Rhodospirillales bacterium]|nr:NADH-quinone oxidoreductase subunit NuoG [Rhodospirillales bacterium]
AGLTVLQACQDNGIEIPHFCYHERLSIAGNCRMCLVEMERAPKPIASCSMPVADGMVIHTNTQKVRQMRQGVMEFLLINHPLDCPICDQGGECDLQDQAMGYGYDRSRYSENKRAVSEKYLGPLVSTVMTRCIHCTRCIRFITEVAGIPELGATGRGEGMEVGTYVEKALTSELSGNIIDLCPVGALTSTPYAFTARSWELRHTESVDVFDAVGSNIRIDTRGAEVMRILPRLNEAVNEEWISDKTRFAYDGLKHKRLDRPWVRRDGRLVEATWTEAFSLVAEKLSATSGDRFAALAGDLADCEAMIALKDLASVLMKSPNLDCRQDGAKLDPSLRASYIFNTGIAGIENSDACLLIGTNPRVEAPVLNARIRKRWRMGRFPVGLIGPAEDLTYDYEHLGDSPEVLDSLVQERHEFAQVLKSAERPILILGQGALRREDGEAILALARQVAEKFGMVANSEDWCGYNVLHTAASRVGGLDVGFVPSEGGLDTSGIVRSVKDGQIDVVYLLGADEIELDGNAFVIYQGHHGDRGAAQADVILPGAAYTEKSATYVNTEGRVQRALLATYPPGEAREDWKIIRALSEVIGKPLKYNSLSEIHDRLVEENEIFSEVDSLPSAPWGEFGKPGKILPSPLEMPIGNFYLTDAISRASSTMSQCSEEYLTGRLERTGTDA